MSRRVGQLSLAAAVVLALLVLTCGAMAQDSLSPWEISIENLDRQLLPLRQEELATECDNWILLLEEKLKELTAAQSAREATEEEAQRAALAEQIATLQLEKNALIDRCETVIAAFEAKGGDGATHTQYIEAVSGLGLDVADTEASVTQIQAWLTSEDGGQKWMWAVIQFGVIIIAFWILARIVGAIVRRAVGRVKGTSTLLRDFMGKLTRKILLLIGAVVAVSALGVDIGPLVAAIGAAGLVIGFALQGTLSNFASGIMILMYRPYDVGDVVSAGGVTGKVESMTLVSTTLITPDNQTIIVPNNSVWGGVITNVTGRPTRRVDLVFGIGYNDDIDRAKDVLSEILAGHELILTDPAPMIEVSELADSSVNFIVRPWTRTGDYWQVYWDLHAEVKRRFDAEGIGIPYPQMDVHVHQTAGA